MIENENNIKIATKIFGSGVIKNVVTNLMSILSRTFFIYFLNMDEKKARATSLFCILPMVLITAFFYGRNNFIHWDIGIKCAIGGIVGGIIGAKLLTKIPNKYLKIIFAGFLIYAGINMIIK